MAKMPAVFIGHGSPLNLILHNEFTLALKHLGQLLPRPEAVLVVSAHWLTHGTWVTSGAEPHLIYDFYGFPEELYEITYPCCGWSADQRAALTALHLSGLREDARHGIDHAVWAVLHHLYPGADVPVMAMSLDVSKPAEYHYQLGRQLQALREQGVLIIGSGNIIHNLPHAVMQEMQAEPADWAIAFDRHVKRLIDERRHEPLQRYEELLGAQLAIPTNDHYLPLLYVLALQQEEEKPYYICDMMQHATISMRSFYLAERPLR